MVKIRFTLRHLLGSAALLALACGALRCPTHFCVSLTLSLALGVLVAALVAAAAFRGTRRAFWLSFAIAGWAHLILALTPWFATGTSEILLSRYCLDQLAHPLGYSMPAGYSTHEELLRHAVMEYGPGSPPDRYYKFIVIGQSILTLFLATMGGLLGQYLCRLQRSRSQTPTSTENGPGS